MAAVYCQYGWFVVHRIMKLSFWCSNSKPWLYEPLYAVYRSLSTGKLWLDWKWKWRAINSSQIDLSIDQRMKIGA
jgi:hypothetical protein